MRSRSWVGAAAAAASVALCTALHAQPVNGPEQSKPLPEISVTAKHAAKTESGASATPTRCNARRGTVPAAGNACDFGCIQPLRHAADRAALSAAAKVLQHDGKADRRNHQSQGPGRHLSIPPGCPCASAMTAIIRRYSPPRTWVLNSSARTLIYYDASARLGLDRQQQYRRVATLERGSRPTPFPGSTSSTDLTRRCIRAIPWAASC